MLDRKTSLIRLALYSTVLSLAALSFSCSSNSVVETNSAKSSAIVYHPPATAPTPVDGKINQYSLPMLDGGSARINDLVGNNKVVLVNFWATWCGPCRKEIPDLVALQRELKDRGFEVVGLTVEDPDNESDRVRAFTQQYSINYKIGFSPKEMFYLFNGSDPRGPIPQTFIFDRQGKLVDSARGLRRDFRAWVEGAVNHALNNS